MVNREQFEAWAVSDAASQGVTLVLRRNGDWYFEDTTNYLNTAWAAWRASRETLVIVLPEPHELSSPDGWCEYDCAKDAIEAAGLKVKPC